VPTPPLESEFEYYKHRLKSIAPNLSKVEEFYQKRTAMLEDKVRDLEDRKDKVRRDRELLAKENRRLQAELQQATDQHSRNQHNRRLQTEEIQARGRKAKQDRLKHLQHEIQREKEVGEGLKVQVDSYQSSLKLMLELQKNLTSIDIESRELKRPSTGSKSKSTISKQPNRHHRHCCSSTFASTQKVKSKSVTAK
jgi:DNA repair exonuclease SbcCD ATPase subunit